LVLLGSAFGVLCVDSCLQAQVGVGIVFQADALGALAVKSLAVGGARHFFKSTLMLLYICTLFACSSANDFNPSPVPPLAGPADKSREIMIGDTLHEIDGINVFQKPLCMCPNFYPSYIPSLFVRMILNPQLYFFFRHARELANGRFIFPFAAMLSALILGAPG
jgi:hypothetical protein